jgi:rod shape-determining protein MreC
MFANRTENRYNYLIAMKFSRTKNKILIFLVVILIVVLLNVFQHNVRDFFYTVSAPGQKSLWDSGAKVSNFFAGIFSAGDLKSENEKLKLQTQELSAKVATLEELQTENDSLRNALQIGLGKDFRLVFARIISKDVGSDIISIDKGSEDGLTANLPVITEQKTLVGKISEVYSHFSKVQLFTDKKSSFDAKISGTQIYGVVKGKGNFNASLELVPREAEIKSGDSVITTSLAGVFPEGLLAGQITNVKKSDVESFQTAEIQPAFDIKQLDNLFIIIGF